MWKEFTFLISKHWFFFPSWISHCTFLLMCHFRVCSHKKPTGYRCWFSHTGACLLAPSGAVIHFWNHCWCHDLNTKFQSWYNLPRESDSHPEQTVGEPGTTFPPQSVSLNLTQVSGAWKTKRKAMESKARVSRTKTLPAAQAYRHKKARGFQPARCTWPDANSSSITANKKIKQVSFLSPLTEMKTM